MLKSGKGLAWGPIDRRWHGLFLGLSEHGDRDSGHGFITGPADVGSRPLPFGDLGLQGKS